MSLVVDKHVPVVMRDGVTLSADVYRAEGAGPRSTVLIRTPYSKDDPIHANTWINVLRAVESGWTVVIQDVRGRFRSEGDFIPFVNEADDGSDTIAWVREQPWSDGNVGMVGGSYAGITQWLAASGDPEGLIGIVPAVVADDVYTGWLSMGDNPAFGFLSSWAAVLVASAAAEPKDRPRIAALVDGVNTGRIRTFDALVDAVPEFGSYVLDWRERGRSLVAPELASRTSVPAFVIGGWFDVFVPGSTASFTRRSATGTPRVHDRLLIGPWAHGVMGGWFPLGRTFGTTSSFDALDPTSLQLDWLEKTRDRADQPVDPVTVFVMGADEWRTFSSWPPAAADRIELPMRPAGVASSNANSWTAISCETPVPTIGGRTMLPGFKVASNVGPRTLNELDGRDDVLAFDSDPLPEDIEAIGDVVCTLDVASTGPTPIVVKLATVDDTGAAEWLAEGSAHITGDSGGTAPIVVDLGPTAVRLGGGTRMRVYVSASDFPALEDGPRADIDVRAPGPALELDVIRSSNAGRHLTSKEKAQWL
jgi:uncharacterized protein